jgi:hypothetical protein
MHGVNQPQSTNLMASSPHLDLAGTYILKVPHLTLPYLTHSGLGMEMEMEMEMEVAQSASHGETRMA